MPYFSLIVATLNRLEENLLLLNSLKSQTFRDFELIIVDQNQHEDLKKAIQAHSAFPRLTYLHPAKNIGLSAARNLGIEEARGEILAFPDDDCWYRENTLQMVKEHFDQEPLLSCLTGLVTDPDGSFSAGGQMIRRKEVDVNIRNVWRCSNSSAIFAKSSVIKQIEGFDTKVGLGTKRYISGEESDLVIRIIHEGLKVYYNPAINIYHNKFRGSYDKEERKRGYGYGLGMGYTLRKNNYGFLAMLYYAGIHLGKGGVMMLTLQFRRGLFHWAQALGRIQGWFEGPRDR